MYDFKDYFLFGGMELICATLVVVCVFLSRWLAVKFGISSLKKKIIFTLLASPIYFFICAVSGIPIFLKTDVMGFLWIQAMFGFALCIFPANLIVLLRPNSKTLLIVLGIGLYLVMVGYMILFNILTC